MGLEIRVSMQRNLEGKERFNQKLWKQKIMSFGSEKLCIHGQTDIYIYIKQVQIQTFEEVWVDTVIKQCCTYI